MSWPSDFPIVLTQTDSATLQSHPLYAAAKGGKVQAATDLVRELVSPEKVAHLAGRYPGAQIAFVHAVEATGRNALPGMYALALEKWGGLEVDDSIVQSNQPQRTGAASGYRMGTRTEFAGNVQAGRDYILADDFITQGGTLADLRDFIAAKGGHIVAATTLAAAPPVKGHDARQLAVLLENLVALERKFSRVALETLLAKYAIHSGHPEALANSEATWLLRFPNAAAADFAIQRDLEQTLARRSGGPAS